MPKRTDVQQLVDAFLEARSILSDYVVPGPRGATATVEQLLDALTNDDVIAAISRIEGRQRFGLVHIE